MLYQTLAAARARLADAGVSAREAAVDVDLFARTALGWDRARLLAEQQSATPAALEPTFSQWLARRERREPSAYIVGVREFWGLDFAVTPDVLIPRPETEFAVEESAALLRQRQPPANGAWRVADIGTGCGCIAVSLAYELPAVHVTATDVSSGALGVARANAARHGVADRVSFVRTSYLDGIDAQFALIASNPPYVRAIDKPALSKEVRHEPDVALFGGGSGLDHIDAVVETAARMLEPGGWLVMEFGFGQEDDVRACIGRRPGLHLLRVRADLQGIPRTAIAQRVSTSFQA